MVALEMEINRLALLLCSGRSIGWSISQSGRQNDRKRPAADVRGRSAKALAELLQRVTHRRMPIDVEMQQCDRCRHRARNGIFDLLGDEHRAFARVVRDAQLRPDFVGACVGPDAEPRHVLT
jgi:hypothetical protein